MTMRCLVVEGGMRERRALGQTACAHVQRHARVALRAVPVAPVALELAEPDRQLVGRRLDLLQADDVGLLALEPLLQLRLPRADAVDVPGGDLHRTAKILCNVEVDVRGLRTAVPARWKSFAIMIGSST